MPTIELVFAVAVVVLLVMLLALFVFVLAGVRVIGQEALEKKADQAHATGVRVVARAAAPVAPFCLGCKSGPPQDGGPSGVVIERCPPTMADAPWRFVCPTCWDAHLDDVVALFKESA